MDKLAEIGLLSNKAAKCSNCGMEKPDSKESGCCKDERKLVKIDKVQKAADASIQTLKLAFQALSTSYFETATLHLSLVTEENPTSNAPPRDCGTAIYKRNCVFRI